MPRACSIDGCERRHNADGLCGMHYNRKRRHGDPLVSGGTPFGAPRAFLESVFDGSAPAEPNGCILWPFSTSAGYAQIRHQGQAVLVGWLVLERFEGPRPEGATMGHELHEVCGNRHCIAPAHLSWQTRHEQIENQRRDGVAFVPDAPAGVSHWCATATDDDVRAAIAMVADGMSQVDVAERFGVSQSTISEWVRGSSRAGVRS